VIVEASVAVADVNVNVWTAETPAWARVIVSLAPTMVAALTGANVASEETTMAAVARRAIFFLRFIGFFFSQESPQSSILETWKSGVSNSSVV
jgi:hypothetical protein